MIHLVTLTPALDISFQLDKPAFGKIGRVLSSELGAGGKSLNLARFLNKLKSPAMTWLGTGGGKEPTHVLYRALLHQEKIKANFLSDKAPIRFNLVTKNKKESLKYNHPGFETDFTQFYKLLKKVKKGDLLVLTGRLPQGANDSLYASWIKIFTRKGVKILIDTSGPALLEAIKAKPWFFKVNRYELSQSLGLRISNLKQMQEVIKKNWLRSHFGHGAVTDSASGALVWRYPECYWVKTATVRSPLVVGAGDGFMAGYLKGISTGKNLKESARLASAVGAAVAVDGIQGFNIKTVTRFLKSVKIRRVL